MKKAQCTVVAGALIAAGFAAVLSGQGQSTQPAKSYMVPKTPWGDPDLQGVWPSTAMVGVPFERSPQFGNRLYLTDAEFKERQKDAERQSQLDNESFSVDNVKAEVVARFIET